ncbi:MAG: potassium channel family protein [Candidatus Dojkabacteria bacterium]|nr:MAG: potassium channel family protein [Candidatus Dojkabacteria bacterium]
MGKVKGTDVGIVLGVVVFFILLGTFVYPILEGWTYIQSFYFSVTTLATVGYGDLHPTTEVSRIFTTFYILIGVTMAVSSFSFLGSRRLDRRVEKKVRKKQV